MIINILKEFREFAVKGNVLDMAVGIIIGGSFGKIVSSLVADVMMPPIGLIIGGVDFSDLRLTLLEATKGSAAVTLNYGLFLQHLIDFTIVAFAVFLLVKGINTVRSKIEKAKVEDTSTPQEKLLIEIRDILKSKH